ncbi:YbhB/YbcL family Raf kinase inhibitor-like protein [Rathayibacter sp. YIM 133350]|uniref:YbhB/YbcL family Raf kinase inhibitor-like protein n=1 Tax=Rathayibacter sp. YIM 133350 TaxID=3131992 RepID=UPI00307E9494
MLDYDPYAALAALRDFPPLTLTSDDLENGQPLKKEQWDAAMGGRDISPQLSWSGAPAETRSFSVSIFDPDAPTGSGFWHWAVFNIPATVTSLARGAGAAQGGNLPEGSVTLPNENRLTSYSGSAPPPGTGTHRYFIVVNALDVPTLDIPADATPAILGFNNHFHSLARGILVGTASSD